MPLPRSSLGKSTADRDTRNLRVRLDLQTVAGGSVTDHGTLIGLGDDDHAQYVHLSAARTITGQHSFTPASPQAPFLLGANAQSQLVTGLRADQLNKSISPSGLGLSGGGTLTASRTITLTSSSNPGAATAILASGSSGYLQLVRIGLGTSPDTYALTARDTTAQARIEYDATNHFEIDVQSDGEVILTATGTGSQFRLNAETRIEFDVSNYLNISVDSSGNATLGSAGAQASLILAPAGDIIVDPTGNDVLPLTTVDINLGAINKRYKTLHAAELWVQTLVAQEVLATIGGRILVGPTTKLEVALSGTNLVVNGFLENRTGNDFDDWQENVGDGAIVAETGAPYEGSSAVKITEGASSNTWMLSSIPVTAGDLIFMELYYKSDGVEGGRWQVWDGTAAVKIPTGADQVTGIETSWTYDHVTFEVPVGCTFLELYLYPPTASTTFVFYDRISMWKANMITEHNQMDNNDTVILESGGFIEYIKINEFAIDAVNTTSEWFELGTIWGDVRASFPVNKYFAVRGSTGNDSTWQVSTVAFTGGKTRITVTGNITDATADGYIAWSSDAAAAGPYTFFRMQRDRDETGINQWDEGSAVFNTGITGDGFIDLYSVAGLISGAGPTITGNVRQSVTYNDIEERWAIGNLNGLYGYAADEYGAAFGDPSGDRVTIEPTGGVQIIGAGGNVTLDSNGLELAADTTGYLQSRAINWFDGGSETFRLYSYNAPTVVAMEGETRIVSGKDSLIEFDVRAATGKKSQFGVNLFADNGSDVGALTFEMLSTGVGKFEIGDTSSQIAMRLNETANANSTHGLTINLGTADNEVISLKSDITHGRTSVTETDTFGLIQKVSDSFGGMALRGFATSSAIAIEMLGSSNVQDATSAVGGLAPISLRAYTTDGGTNVTALASDENIVVMRNATSSRWILKGDGEIHSDFHTGGGTGHANYDSYNDAQLLRAFDIQHSALETADAWFNQNLQTLQELGIIHDVRPDGMFVSQQKMTKLQIGAIWQLYQRIETLEAQLERMV